MRNHHRHVIGLAALATLAYACSATRPSDEPSATIAPAASVATAKSVLPSAERAAEDPWLAEIHKKPTPHDGCFTATPGVDHEWREVPCGAAPLGARPRQKGLLSAPVASAPASASEAAGTAGVGAKNGGRPPTAQLVGGGGGDSTGSLQSGLLLGATGSFPSVVGGAAEGDLSGNPAEWGFNSYTLQLNTNVWGTGAPPSAPTQCNGATNFNCRGWEQFVYDALAGTAYVEYTLINYGPVEAGRSQCPGGYTAYPNYSSQPDCYFNTNTISVPSVAPDNLQGVVMKASTNGTSDFLEMDVNGVPYKGSWSSVEGLATGWTSAEFNIFGDSNGTQATYYSATTMEVQVLLDMATPSVEQPSISSSSSACPGCGTSTAETNTLNLIGSACAFGGTQPGFQFMESNVTGAVAPPCPSLAVTAAPLFVPQGDFAQSTVILNGDLVGQSSNTALYPTTCAVTSGTPTTIGATLEPTAGSNITLNYHVPSTAPVGSKFSDTLLCNNGQQVNQPIVVSAPNAANQMYLSPGNNPLEVVQGSESSANLLMYGPWQATDRGAGAVGQVLSNPIPGGTITLYPAEASEDGMGVMGVMVTTSSSTTPATYSVEIVVTDPASQVALISTFSVEVICLSESSSSVCTAAADGAPMCGEHAAGCGISVNCGTCPGGAACGSNGYCPCVPTVTSCSSAQSCGSIVNNCGQTIECGGSCSSGDTCSNNLCCPNGEVNSNGTCCPSGETGGNGVCCPAGEAPAGTHCCPTGDLWSGTACITPVKGGGGGGGCRCTKTSCNCE